jgi:hypothetical protein
MNYSPDFFSSFSKQIEKIINENKDKYENEEELFYIKKIQDIQHCFLKDKK